MLGLWRKPRLLPRIGWAPPNGRRRWRTPSGRRKRRTRAPATPIAFTAYITEVSDGDGLRVETRRGKRIEVRLAYIDAPEHDQPGGREAKSALKRLVREGGRKATITAVQRSDPYGRMIATAANAKGCLNEQLVEQGHAWVEPRYVSGETERRYTALEHAAKQAARGLWGTSETPIAPWTWRKRQPAQEPRRTPGDEVWERKPETAAGAVPERADKRGGGSAWVLVLITAAVVTMCTITTEPERGPRAPMRESAPASAPEAQGEARARADVRERVRAIQRMLDALGYAPGPADGVWGPKTQDAFERFAEREAPGHNAAGVAKRLRERYAER